MRPRPRFQYKHRSRRRNRRWGATLVETAFILPVFTAFTVGMVEFGHAYMVRSMLTSAAKQAARFGAIEGITNAEVNQRINDILNAAVYAPAVDIKIYDAAVFDDADFNHQNFDYDNLSEVPALEALETRDLFVIRLEVPYENVALFPTFWIKNATLSGVSVMRHE
ncbi:MAG: TadE/TadG family type IV pilus assembly protein [Planctomycetota bacterium]